MSGSLPEMGAWDSVFDETYLLLTDENRGRATRRDLAPGVAVRAPRVPRETIVPVLRERRAARRHDRIDGISNICGQRHGGGRQRSLELLDGARADDRARDSSAP